MAGEPLVTIVGNAARDAEIRYTRSGVAVCSFTVVSTPRVKNGDTWEDGDPTFFRCQVWNGHAEHAAALHVAQCVQLFRLLRRQRPHTATIQRSAFTHS